ncbi:MAG: acyltransferase [Alphaproteobacteria bacterium]|nr:acyltransferase [Alphaproteobacteria bacterium]
MRPANRPSEIKALAGARALPPLVLVLFHFCEGHGYRGLKLFDLPVGKGYLWVEFFFALSGFILIHVYGARAQEFWRGKAYVPFLQARLARLYPIHLVTLLSMLFLMWTLNGLADLGGYASIYHQPWHPMNTWPSFIANLFLVQGWNLFPWLTWNGASWFVSVELLLCLLFPIYVLLSRGGLLQALALIGAGVAALILMAETSGHGLDITYHDGIFRGMAGFAIGVGMATLYRLANEAGMERIPEWVHSAAQLALLGLLYWAIYRTGWAHRPADLWTALTLDASVLLLAFDRGFLARALSTAVPRKLGEWSYAIYMGQTFWLQLIRYFEQHFYPPPDTIVLGCRWVVLTWWLEPAMLLLICIAWGALLAIFVEHPANAALRRMFAQRKPANA